MQDTVDRGRFLLMSSLAVSCFSVPLPLAGVYAALKCEHPALWINKPSLSYQIMSHFTATNKQVSRTHTGARVMLWCGPVMKNAVGDVVHRADKSHSFAPGLRVRVRSQRKRRREEEEEGPRTESVAAMSQRDSSASRPATQLLRTPSTRAPLSMGMRLCV